MTGDMCGIAGCYGPNEKGQYHCRRHLVDMNAPPMPVHCECVDPIVELLRAFGPTAAQCRRCGSPLLEALT